MAGRQLDLIRRARDFRLLFLAAVGSGLGTRLAVMVLMVDVWDRTHSGKWVAALLVADFVPIIVIGLLLGSLVDRFSRRKLMIASDLIRCAVFVALPFTTGPAQVVALAGVAGFATGFFRPALYAGLPNLVDDEELANANGIFQAAENITWMLGPLLGGVLLSFSTPDIAYWFNAVTFLASALLIARIAERKLQTEKALSEGHWRDLAEGFRLASQLASAANRARRVEPRDARRRQLRRRRGRAREGRLRLGQLRLRAADGRLGARPGSRQLRRGLGDRRAWGRPSHTAARSR